MPDVHVGVLGALEVSVDGRPVAVPPGRRRAVLACLALHRGRPVSADELVEAAWGEALPRDPHAALHTVISRLRTSLDGVVRHEGPAGYRLDLPPEGLDAAEFEDLLDRADTADTADTAGAKGARRLLEQALALWRGPAYGELASAPFAMVDAMRLEGRRADATEHLAGLAVEAGDAGTAVALTEDLLSEEPFRERAVEVLVTALYRDGRQADALAACRRYRARLARELGLDPVPTLARLEQQILGHDLPAPSRPSEPPVWLDTSTAFIGREDDLADLVAAVTRNRLTVVTGPGGVGKSRLVAEALPVLHDRLRLPMCVVELASVPDGGVPLAVASSLGLTPRSADAASETLVDHLAAAPHVVVLDNCEHLRVEVAALTRRLVTAGRGLRVLATSRRRLGVDSEQLLPLAPLTVPDPGDPGAERMVAAVRLVTDRVRRLSPAFAVTPENAAQVGELCRRLDGLPLALELAASRVATRGVAEVLKPWVPDRDGEADDGLGPVVAWSYRLLTPQQQTLLCDLSVFTGDFGADEVRGLVDHLPGGRGDVMDALAGLTELVESSLVSCRVHGTGVRYRLLVIVRAFAAERLWSSGRSDEAHRAHAEWVAEGTEEIARDWYHHDGAEMDARLRLACEEVVPALRWTLGAGRLDLAARIVHSVGTCLHWTPSVEVTDLFVEVAERGAASPGPELAGGVGVGAFAAADRGDLDDADRLARAALRMAGDRDEPVTAVLALAVAAMYRGDHEETQRWFHRLGRHPDLIAEANASLALGACYHEDLPAAREHVALALAAGASAPDATRAFVHFAAGEIAVTEDLETGADHLARAVVEADRVGAEQVGRVARVALLATLTRIRRHGEAAALAPHLLGDLRAKGAWVQMWTALRIVAELLADCGRPADAAFVLEAASVADAAPPLVGQDVERYTRLAEELTDRLGTSTLAGIRRLAAATSRTQVVARTEAALAPLAPTSDPGQPRLWDTE